MKGKYICTLTCNICGKELTTGWCKTRIGRFLKKKYIMHKHYHTKAEVIGFNMFGIYIPTTKKKWEK